VSINDDNSMLSLNSQNRSTLATTPKALLI
jgi:hypothetical protein